MYGIVSTQYLLFFQCKKWQFFQVGSIIQKKEFQVYLNTQNLNMKNKFLYVQYSSRCSRKRNFKTRVLKESDIQKNTWNFFTQKQILKFFLPSIYVFLILFQVHFLSCNFQLKTQVAQHVHFPTTLGVKLKKKKIEVHDINIT